MTYTLLKSQNTSNTCLTLNEVKQCFFIDVTDTSQDAELTAINSISSRKVKQRFLFSDSSSDVFEQYFDTLEEDYIYYLSPRPFFFYDGNSGSKAINVSLFLYQDGGARVSVNTLDYVFDPSVNAIKILNPSILDDNDQLIVQVNFLDSNNSMKNGLFKLLSLIDSTRQYNSETVFDEVPVYDNYSKEWLINKFVEFKF